MSLPFASGRPAGDLEPFRLMAGSDATDGLVVLGEAFLAPHTSGPPRHVHTREDEAVLVASGTLTVHLGDQTHSVGPGGLAWMARNVPHHFENLGDEPVHGFGVITPGGLDRFFAEREEYLRSLTGPPDQQYILALNEKYGVFPA